MFVFKVNGSTREVTIFDRSDVIAVQRTASGIVGAGTGISWQVIVRGLPDPINIIDKDKDALVAWIQELRIKKTKAYTP